MESETLQPALYLLPTGMSDASPEEVLPRHNIEILKKIRNFVVENVRTARRWIRRCDPAFSFEGVEFTELNKRTSPAEIGAMLEPLRKGLPIGVMSEAGCPAVADPGADIVAVAQKEGLKVVPLVGPSSILLSLMGSGFNGQSFCFHGYLPIEDKERQMAIRKLEKESERENRTQIFIETPYRNHKLMEVLLSTLAPDTRLCVAVDLTAPTEQITTRTVSAWHGAKYDLNKRPAIFLFYRGLNTQRGELIAGTKRKK